MKTFYNIRLIFKDGTQEQWDVSEHQSAVDSLIRKIERDKNSNAFQIVVTEKQHNGLFFDTISVFTAWEATDAR